MTNLEKYREEIEKAITQLPIENCKKLLNLSRDKCICSEKCDEFMHNFVDWLLEESKTDWSQVEPGTKCLVKDDEDSDWREYKFAGFVLGRPWFISCEDFDNINTMTFLYNFDHYKI